MAPDPLAFYLRFFPFQVRSGPPRHVAVADPSPVSSQMKSERAADVGEKALCDSCFSVIPPFVFCLRSFHLRAILIRTQGLALSKMLEIKAPAKQSG